MVANPRTTGRPTRWIPQAPRPADYWRDADRARPAGAGARHAPRIPAAADGLLRLRRHGAHRASPRPSGSRRTSPGRRPSCRALAAWLTLPWTAKMVFGEMVDTVPLLGSQRRVYVFIGAGMVAVSFVLLSGAAGGWITVLPPGQLYVVAALLSVTGRRAAGRGGRRHEHGGGGAHQPGRQPAAEGRDRPRPRHGAGARPAGAVVRHLRGRRTVGLAGAMALLPDRVPARPDRAVDLRLGRAAGAARDQRAATDRLAHPGRRPRLRRRRHPRWL